MKKCYYWDNGKDFIFCVEGEHPAHYWSRDTLFGRLFRNPKLNVAKLALAGYLPVESAHIAELRDKPSFRGNIYVGDEANCDKCSKLEGK